MKLFGSKNFEDKSPIGRILPEDVRYALRYKEGKLNNGDIEVMNHTHFEYEAAYLALKSFRNNREEHQAFFRELVQISAQEMNPKEETEQIKLLVDKELAKSEKDSEVNGVKLAQISRQGFENWQKKFEVTAKEFAKDKREVFLLAHSMIIGLHHFVHAFKEENKDFNVLIPSWIDKEGQDGEVGYKISFNNDNGSMTVSILDKNFSRENAIIIDDIKNTGKTLENILDFWKKDASVQDPDIFTIEKVNPRD